MGYHYLTQSSTGDRLSVYHLESAIAAEHCLSRILNPPTGRLCCIYTTACWNKTHPGGTAKPAILLAQLNDLPAAMRYHTRYPGVSDLLKHHYIYPSVLGDLYGKAGNKERPENTWKLPVSSLLPAEKIVA